MADENEIRRRVERYERALHAILWTKPGERLTEADHERAVEVAALVERYEAHLRAAVKPHAEGPEELSARPRAPVRRRRKRRPRVAQPAAVAQPKRRGRPRRITPPTEDIPGG